MANNSITVVVHPETSETDPALPIVDRNQAEMGSLSLKVDWRDNQNTWQAVRVYGFQLDRTGEKVDADPDDVFIASGDEHPTEIDLKDKIEDERVVKYKVDYLKRRWTADPVFRERP